MINMQLAIQFWGSDKGSGLEWSVKQIILNRERKVRHPKERQWLAVGNGEKSPGAERPKSWDTGLQRLTGLKETGNGSQGAMDKKSKIMSQKNNSEARGDFNESKVFSQNADAASGGLRCEGFVCLFV